MSAFESVKFTGFEGYTGGKLNLSPPPSGPSLQNQLLRLEEILPRSLYPGHNYEFISLGLAIKDVDPLAILHHLKAQQEYSFFLENSKNQISTLACGQLDRQVCEGQSRFKQAHGFIEHCQAHTLTIAADDSELKGPHFFCNFTFCDHPVPQLWRNNVFADGLIVLPHWHLQRDHHQCRLTVNLLVAQVNTSRGLGLMREKIERLVYDLYRWSEAGIVPFKSICQQNFIKSYVLSPNQYREGVRRAVETIRQHKLEKIVLANAIDVECPTPFQIAPSLQILRRTYPKCYIFASQQPEGATFLGASPEVLLKTSDRQLSTEAIAGSAPRGETQAKDLLLAHQLLQGQKERHEHQVVVEFIVNCLQQLGLKPQFPRSLALQQLTNIQHLWTPIKSNLGVNVHPLDVLAQLHPTPAMAGMPRDLVVHELKHYEPFDRLLYAAPLGWVDAHGNSEFVVGIRSALIEGNHARLYAGAGVVEGSDADQEFAEVELKLRTLLETLV